MKIPLTLDPTQGCTLHTVAVPQLLQIGQVAALAGVSVDAVRYYERLNLLTRAPRSTGNFRLFTPDAVERIRFIKQAQEIGLSLNEIRLLIPADRGGAQCREVRDLLAAKLTELDVRLTQMRSFRRKLAAYLSECEQALTQQRQDACPVLSELSHTQPVVRKENNRHKERKGNAKKTL